MYSLVSADSFVNKSTQLMPASGFGAVPASIALYYRLTIPETPRYTFDVARDVEKAGTDVTAYMAGESHGKVDEITRAQALSQSTALEVPKASFLDFIKFYGRWKNGKILLGTAGSWFFLDVSSYSLYCLRILTCKLGRILRSRSQLVNCAVCYRLCGWKERPRDLVQPRSR